MHSDAAGFWIRLVAVIIDGIIIGILGSLFNALLGLDLNDGERGITGLFEFLYGLIVPVLWTGYTIGKKAMGVRIVKLDGSDVTIGTMLMRTLVAGLVYAVTLGIGVIVSAFMVGLREDKRSIHDFIAGTYVTYQKPGI